MILTLKPAASRPHYAFDRRTWRPTGYGSFEVDAVWARRRDGVLAVVTGVYRPMVLGAHNQPSTGDYLDWVGAADDNRYGGNWVAKWDGHSLKTFASGTSADEHAAHIAFLDPILKAYPSLPPGYDGWYVFPKSGR